jgi:hypothetical protein
VWGFVGGPADAGVACVVGVWSCLCGVHDRHPLRASPRRTQGAKSRGGWGSWGGVTRPCGGGLSRRGDGWSRKWRVGDRCRRTA